MARKNREKMVERRYIRYMCVLSRHTDTWREKEGKENRSVFMLSPSCLMTLDTSLTSNNEHSKGRRNKNSKITYMTGIMGNKNLGSFLWIIIFAFNPFEILACTILLLYLFFLSYFYFNFLKIVYTNENVYVPNQFRIKNNLFIIKTRIYRTKLFLFR